MKLAKLRTSLLPSRCVMNQDLDRFFRGDAAFVNPDIYEYLESEDFLYAIRLPANDILQNNIAHLLKRPVG